MTRGERTSDAISPLRCIHCKEDDPTPGGMCGAGGRHDNDDFAQVIREGDRVYVDGRPARVLRSADAPVDVPDFADTLDELASMSDRERRDRDGWRAVLQCAWEGGFKVGAQRRESAPPEPPICEVCGEEHNPQRVYGEVEVCRSCLMSAEHAIEMARTECAGLREVVDAAMLMYAACPADPDTTQKYEAAVDTFIDALAKIGLRMPASLPADSSSPDNEGSKSQ